MPDPRIKQRLRRRSRLITTTLEAQGYKVKTLDGEPFHLMACRGKTGKAIRICFSYATTDDILGVKREPLPARCLREIWQISDDGRVTVKAKVS